MTPFTPREQIIETVHRLFIHTDEKRWDALRTEVFTDDVRFDMSTLGGPSGILKAEEICAMWEKGFDGIQSVDHLSGNHLVTLEDENAARVFCYATATHFIRNSKVTEVRTFVGTYHLHLVARPNGWRIDEFRYLLKYNTTTACV